MTWRRPMVTTSWLISWKNVRHEARTTLLGAAAKEFSKDEPGGADGPVVVPFKPKPTQR